jgi:hypothetical protein
MVRSLAVVVVSVVTAPAMVRLLIRQGVAAAGIGYDDPRSNHCELHLRRNLWPIQTGVE